MFLYIVFLFYKSTMPCSVKLFKSHTGSEFATSTNPLAIHNPSSVQTACQDKPKTDNSSNTDIGSR